MGSPFTKMSKIISRLRSVSIHKKSRIILLLVMLIGLVFGGIYYRRIWGYFLELTAAFQSIETARAYIASYGALAPVVSAILMVFQSVIAPLPAFLITFANGTLFGVWWGSLLSWSSSMVGAAVCFYIARYLGIQRITQLISQPAVEKANDFVEKYGTYAILIARLMPFISFDVISYFAGATRMRFLGFGSPPASVNCLLPWCILTSVRAHRHTSNGFFLLLVSSSQSQLSGG